MQTIIEANVCFEKYRALSKSTSYCKKFRCFRNNFIFILFYLQTSPRTIWQERSHRTIVLITRLQRIRLGYSYRTNALTVEGRHQAKSSSNQLQISDSSGRTWAFIIEKESTHFVFTCLYLNSARRPSMTFIACNLIYHISTASHRQPFRIS